MFEHNRLKSKHYKVIIEPTLLLFISFSPLEVSLTSIFDNQTINKIRFFQKTKII